MKITILTPKKNIYESECISLVIYDHKNGSFGILKGCVPCISSIEDGYIEVTVDEEKKEYIILKSAILKFKNDEASVITQIYKIGSTLEEAIQRYNDFKENRIKENRERNIELALAENELKKQIKKTGAGNM